MSIQTSTPNNIQTVQGNGLAVFIQADGNLYLKDTNGKTAPLSDYISGSSGGVNIYNADGTLTANRVLSLNDLNLNFVDSLGNNIFSSTGSPLTGNSQTTIITSNNSGNEGSQSKTMHLANNGVVVHDSSSNYGAGSIVANALHVANSSGASNSITSLVGDNDKVQLSQQANAFSTIGSLTASDTEDNKAAFIASTSKFGGNNKASLVSISQNTLYQATQSFETSTANNAIAFMSVTDLVNDHTAGIRLETDDTVSNLKLFADKIIINDTAESAIIQTELGKISLTSKLSESPTAKIEIASTNPDDLGSYVFVQAGGNQFYLQDSFSSLISTSHVTQTPDFSAYIQVSDATVILSTNNVLRIALPEIIISDPISRMGLVADLGGNCTWGMVGLCGYTVVTLPPNGDYTPKAGDRAFVTDATVNTYGIAPTGSGALTVPVFFDGANWIIG